MYAVCRNNRTNTKIVVLSPEFFDMAMKVTKNTSAHSMYIVLSDVKESSSLVLA
jgi:hypothetical protein